MFEILLFIFFKIFIADDLTLKSKSTHFLSVVKSSKIITGFFKLDIKMLFLSFVHPKIKVFPGVKTGIAYSLVLFFSILFAIYLVGWKYSKTSSNFLYSTPLGHISLINFSILFIFNL